MALFVPSTIYQFCFGMGWLAVSWAFSRSYYVGRDGYFEDLVFMFRNEALNLESEAKSCGVAAIRFAV
jgi:hypothetical protein